MFETKSSVETLNELNVEQKTGLSSEDAKSRLEKYGPNEIAEKKRKNVFLVFLSQLNDPMIFVLFGAALISLILNIITTIRNNASFQIQDFADVFIILAVVLLNATIGTVQERKADNALQSLKKMASPEALVRRDGELKRIKTSDLVPGDILVLEEGDLIGADIRLIETHNFKADESSLTGESLSIQKDADFVFSEEVGVGDRVNMAYMNTPCVYGRGEGVVTSTGMNTEMGKIAKMLSGKEEKTPLQKKLASLSKLLGIITLVIVVAIFGIMLIQIFVQHQADPLDKVFDALLDSIALAVAAVPEGLVAVVTIVLAIGVQRMVKANAIVRKLPSVETLGAVTYVCSDKTGTLTQNKMTVVEAYCDDKVYELNDFTAKNVGDLASLMTLCSNGSIENGIHGDPTEIALVEMADHVGYKKSYLEEQSPRVDEFPFDSVRKMMSVSVKKDNKRYLITKGALDSVIKGVVSYRLNGKIVKWNKEYEEHILEQSKLMSEKALRVLTVAYKESDDLNEDNLIFVGLVGMTDPARPECGHAVAEFKRAGIIPVMITGDQAITAFAIAKELGIADDPDQCISGADLDQMTPEEIQEVVKTKRVFSRVSPTNKVSIVTAIKANGNVAAMTGDGVNDAPSLKAADIGIAMGVVGTDVAKSAADMVLTDDNFASIEKAVEEGRGIYANIKKAVLFLLSSNIGEVIVMFIAIVCGLPSPLAATQILWVNLVTDSMPAIALGNDKKDDGIMSEKPRGVKESLFAKGGYFTVFGYGILIGLLVLFAFLSVPFHEGRFTIAGILDLFKDTQYLEQAETSAFIVMSFSELFHMIGMRTTKKSAIVEFFRKFNWVALVAFVVGFALQIVVVQVPGLNSFFHAVAINDPLVWLELIGYSAIPLLVHEIVALIIFIVNKVKNRKSRKKLLKQSR